MAKYDIGVGEDFPVEEPPRDSTGTPGNESRDGRRAFHGHHGHHGWFGFFSHVMLRFAFIALAVGAIVWLLSPHFYGAYVYAPYHGPFAYPPHFFFGPVIFVLIVLALFAFRHHHWHGHHGHRHGHHGHGSHGHDHGEA